MLPRYWPDNAFDVMTMEAAQRAPAPAQAARPVHRPGRDRRVGPRPALRPVSRLGPRSADRFLAELWKTVQADARVPRQDGAGRDHRSRPGRRRGPTGPITARRFDGGVHLDRGPRARLPALGVRENVETTQSQVAATIAAPARRGLPPRSPKAAAACRCSRTRNDNPRE